MDKGLISKIFDWMTHPAQSEGNVTTWLAFLVLILIASFLWSTVVKQLDA